MSWSVMRKKKIKQSFLFHRYAKGARPMTREEVSEATARFLSSGGQIQRIGKERAVPNQMVNEKEWREVFEEWDLN